MQVLHKGELRTFILHLLNHVLTKQGTIVLFTYVLILSIF